VITITGTGSGAITINSLTTSTFQIQGTPNQITVASSAPNIIALSLPQNIGTTNVPTFGGLILNGNATTTNITISGISGSTQCLHVNANGVVSGTGSDCGSGGSSIPGALNDLLYSLGNGTAGVDTGKATYSSTTEIMTVPMLLVQKPVNGTGGSNNLSGITLKPLDGTGKSLASWDNVHTDGPDLYIGGGFLYTRNAIIISGTYHGTGGGYAIDPPTLDPSMLSIQSDVGGPSIQVAASSASGSYNASFLDPNHNYVLNIEANGSLTWSSSTRAAIDTGLGRCGVSTLCLGNGTAGNYSGILKANGVTQASGDTSTLLATDAFVLANVGGGGPPSGAAGGDLSGTYPNPVVVGVNGLTIPASQAFVGTNASSEIVAATAGALPSGTTATTQTAGDNSNKVATDAFVLANGSGNSLAATVHVQTNDWICAHAGDTSIAGQHCTNTVDAVTGIASSNAQVEFATVASVAANYFSSSDTLHAAPQRVRITAEFRNWSTATTPQHDLRVNNTANQEFYDSGFSPAAVSQSGSIWSATWNITATAAADGHVTIGSEFVGMPVAYGYAPPQTGGMFNVAAGTSAYSIFIFDLWGSATGVASGSYTSGGSITGSAGQTCTVSGFNNGNTGGAATVTLTGTNTIAGGTSLSITNTGYGSTGAATTATLGNGTATCSGTATIATVLGGAQGNADQLIGLTFQPLN
jgi:hypothetical protein